MTQLPRKLSDAPGPPPGRKPPGQPPGDKTSEQWSSDLVKGLRVLLVERDSIFALATEDMLLRGGALLVDVVTSHKEAMLHLEKQQYDIALIDLKLASDACLAIATRLQALSVPFAFAAEYSAAAAPPGGFADCMVISKPYSETYLLKCLTRLVGG